jgi:hypothetical protein
LWDSWALRGLLRESEERAQVVEYLHAEERELAWDLMLASVEQADMITPSEHNEALRLLSIGWLCVDAVPPAEHLDRVLDWTRDRNGPFPQVT